MEEPALGASADALASQVGMKREPSLELPKDLQLSPEATKRPLEPTNDQENGDSKRPRLDETVHDDSVMDMDLDLDAMVQDVLGDIDNQMSKFGGLESAADAEMSTQSMEPAVALEPAEPAATILSDPTKAIQIASLPSLTNFAFQILLILAHESLLDLPAAIRNTDSETSLSWTSLKSLFAQTRALFSKSSPLLRPRDDLDHIDVEERRIADLASLCCSLTSSGASADSDERCELYKTFFATVLRPGVELSQGTANLFVAVKTQAIIDSVARGVQEKPIDQLIEEAFPSDLEQQLIRRHEGLELTDIERSLVMTTQQRREELLSHIAGGQNESQLRTIYDVEELFRLVNTYLRNELQGFADIALKYAVQLPQPVLEEVELDDSVSEMDENALESLLQATDGLVAQYLPNGGVEDSSTTVVPTTEDNATMTDSQPAATDDVSTATTAPTTNGVTTAESTLPDHHDLLAEIDLQTQEYVRTTLSNLSPAPYQPTVPQPTGVSLAHTPYLSHIQQAQQAQQQAQQAQQAQQHGLQSQQPQQHHHQHHQQPTHYYGYAHDPSRAALGDENAPLPPSQSLPSSVLYDRARQAALSKNTNPQRREGGSSTRRPWSQEEEKALMMGLDKVQGPHWSQILSLYGVGGSISNILKDRSQVQLKDKARNLKLFFLKSNSEMPYYLQAVTGELKTRAPSQAARKEAEEKARQNSEEAQVRGQHGFPMAHQALQASPHSQQKNMLPNHHAFHALQQATQAMSPQVGTTLSTAPPLLPAVAPVHQALAPSPATVTAIASAASQSIKTEQVPLAPQPAAVTAAPPAPSTPTTVAATPYLPQAAQTPHQVQTPMAHTPTAHTPVQSYTPTHSYTPTQSAPTASPRVQAAPSAEPVVPTQQEDPAIKSEAALLPEDAPAGSTPLYGLDEHDDLKDAALMQSLRELEAYSGSTSVS